MPLVGQFAMEKTADLRRDPTLQLQTEFSPSGIDFFWHVFPQGVINAAEAIVNA